MDFVKRRVLLSVAAISPGALLLSVMDLNISISLMSGLIGACALAAAAIALRHRVTRVRSAPTTRGASYTSLLLPQAALYVRKKAPDPLLIRASLNAILASHPQARGFLTEDQQVAMVLTRIMARWGCTDVIDLTDDQVRELWLVDQLMRASPAEAGPLAYYFAAPDAMLAMRDSLAATVAG